MSNNPTTIVANHNTAAKTFETGLMLNMQTPSSDHTPLS
jgi:hypothetical protein